MSTFRAGDEVQYTSLCSETVFYGKIVGFYGKNLDMALCTDQTGLTPRPVGVDRLRRNLTPNTHKGRAA